VCPCVRWVQRDMDAHAGQSTHGKVRGWWVWGWWVGGGGGGEGGGGGGEVVSRCPGTGGLFSTLSLYNFSTRRVLLGRPARSLGESS
jgi:hypothetical protein